MHAVWVAIRLAVASLTIWPVRLTESDWSPASLAASRYAYPLVGAVLGVVLAVASTGLSRVHTSPQVSAFFLLAVAAVITGGLHLDGLADSFDGLFLSGGPERRLTVMRDPHVGSFGVVAIVLVLVGKFAALSGMAVGTRGRALFLAAFASRCLILVSAGFAPYARPEGTGRIVVEAASPRDAFGAILIASVVSFACLGSKGLAACAIALATVAALTTIAVRRLNGITGDILGCVVELGELSVLLALC